MVMTFANNAHSGQRIKCIIVLFVISVFFGSVTEAFEFFDTTSLEGVVKRINRTDEGGDGLSDYYIDKYEKYCRERFKK